MPNKRRNERKAYFQQADQAPMDPNTDNNPDKLGYPGEVKYKNAPMAVPVGEDSRPWEQRWFEGAAAITKKVMGPQGSEFELKKEWQRILPDAKVANASLSSGFTRTAKPQDSYWTFYTVAKDGTKTPILRASLGDIWGKKLNEELANKTATQEYAKKVFAKIRKDGFNTVAYLLTGGEQYLKQVQAQMYNNDEVDVVEDVTEAPALDGADDLGAALDAEFDETAAEGEVTIEMLEQKHAELEAAQTELVEATSPETTGEVFMQLQNAEKMIDEAKEEMQSAVASLRDKTRTAAQKIKLIKAAAEAIDDAAETMEAADVEIDGAKAAMEAADDAIQSSAELVGEGGGTEEIAVDDAAPAIVEVDAPMMGGDVDVEEALASSNATDYVKSFLNSRKEKRAIAMEGDTNSAEQGKYQVVPEGAPKDGDEEIARAHPQGGADVTNLTAGGKPKDNGERFETVVEAQDVDLAVANKMPTGNLNGQSGDPNSDSTATASAKKKVVKASASETDSATKEFWAKLLWGEAPAGDSAAHDFGKDLYKDFQPGGSATAAIKEHISKVVTAASEETAAKVKRAYELTEVAVAKGLCSKTAEAKSDFVTKVMELDDKGFVAYKNVLDAAPERAVATAASETGFIATASRKIPNVGLLDDTDVAASDLQSKLTDNFGWS